MTIQPYDLAYNEWTTDAGSQDLIDHWNRSQNKREAEALVGGLLAFTWVLSGLFSMNPWKLFDAPGRDAQRQVPGVVLAMGPAETVAAGRERERPRRRRVHRITMLRAAM